MDADFSTRLLTPGDLAAVFAVYAADEVADSGHLGIEVEDIQGDWARATFDLPHDAIGVTDAGGRLVAAAEVSRGGTHAEGAVHPDARGRGIGTWLLRWTEARSRDLGAPAVGQSVPRNSAAEQCLRAAGYALGHTSWVLQLPEGRTIPERPLPPGHHIVTGGTAARERAAYEIIEAAFGEWEGRRPETYADWRATTVDRPGAEPWQLRLVETGASEPVAAAFTILDSGGAGYVHQLAVARVARGQGLAQALLVDAFARARERGAARSELSTDSRTGALSLYEKVGMEVTQTWVHLRTAL